MEDNKGYEIAVSERFKIGPLVGWAFYTPDEHGDWYEFNLYLLFFMIHIKWWEIDEE